MILLSALALVHSITALGALPCAALASVMAERSALALQLEAAVASALSYSHMAAELEAAQSTLLQCQLELREAQQRAEAAEVGEKISRPLY